MSKRTHLNPAIAALAALLASGAIAQNAPLPSIQITGISSSNGCSDPGATLTVFGNGTVANSDNFVLQVNGTNIFTWTGETMAWSPPPPGGIAAYGVNGPSSAFPAGSIITAVITTFSGAATGIHPTSGQLPVFESRISWNCTTGAQVGSVVNTELRTAAVPTLFAQPLSALAFLLGLSGLLTRRRRV